MELLENAAKITTYCDQQRLDLNDRLRLLIEVCQIVQHAHQRGVIHRDLKPSNVLICKTLEGSTPKVIDFGIAKAIEGDLRDDSNLTVLGERMGTPAYMSPEQARHSAVGIDVRTDVYSLGALLYELISGQVPREQPTLKDSGRFTDTHWDRPIVAPSVRVARSPESAKTSAARRCSPAQLQSQLQGELDWITLKALSTDRGERYQSVADLQRDVERFLSGQPVEAAGPSSLYRLRKFIGRNRVLTTATAAVLLTIVATTIISTSFAVRANRAEKDAQTRLAEVLQMQSELTEQRDLASTAEKKAQGLLRAFQVQAVAEHAFYQYAVSRLQGPQSAVDAATLESFDQEYIARMLRPDPRLIVKGNWNWSSQRLDLSAELIKATVKLTSREVAESSQIGRTRDLAEPHEVATESLSMGEQAASMIPNSSFTSRFSSSQAVTAASNADRSRLGFQQIFLQELATELAAEDPFLAEVNDNCGLQLMDQQEYAQAEDCFRKAIKIWSDDEKYASHRIQSQLFRVRCLIKQAKLDDAAKQLDTAIANLGSIRLRTPEVDALGVFAGSIKDELQGQIDQRSGAQLRQPNE